MKIRPVGAELYHADGQTGRHDQANGRYSQIGKALNKSMYIVGAICLTACRCVVKDTEIQH